jgi:putative sterol carrier protein
VVSPESVPLLVTMALGRLATLGRGEKTDGTWQLDVEGPTGGPVAVRVQSDQVSVERGPATNPDARLTLDGDAFVRLAWGRLDLPQAIAAGKVRVEGDRDRALALQRLFCGI